MKQKNCSMETDPEELQGVGRSSSGIQAQMVKG